MRILFSVNNFQETLELPIIPEEFNISNPFKNQEFEGVNADYNLQGNAGLRTLSLSSFFPETADKYYFQKSKVDCWECVNFFKKWIVKKYPFRIIVTHNKVEVLNMPCLIENFEYVLDVTGDIKYTLDIKEFRLYG